ncbi:MAG TPA: glycosyltransferase family 4 protein, partial [Chitinophagaceae bacterium]|nr:glycosyltransferase family 4 protein [Chitinophagaceae bacterium]
HKGHRVVVLTVNPLSSDRDITEITDDIVKVTLQESYQAFVHLYKPFFRPGGHDAPNWLAMGLAIRDWLLRNTGTYAIDLIDISDYGGLGTFLVGKDLPPFVISAHGSLHQLQPFNHQFETDHTRVIKRLETSAFENAGAVIAHSYLNKESVEKTFNIRVDFARAPWQSENLPLDSSGEDQGPLVIGGLQNTKGAIVMARTIQESGDEGHPFNLKWIGYDTYTAPTTDLMSVYLANMFPDVWQKRFQWRGRMDYEGTMKELAAGSFLVIPSLWETFNYTALEAAVMGKAAIITKTSGVSYVFKHAHDALLIEPGDTQELAHAIRMLNRDPSLRRQM